jgi:hypothetical protein
MVASQGPYDRIAKDTQESLDEYLDRTRKKLLRAYKRLSTTSKELRKMKTVTACIDGNDDEALRRDIYKQHGGVCQSVTYDVLASKAKACKQALEDAGFTIAETVSLSDYPERQQDEHDDPRT